MDRQEYWPHRLVSPLWVSIRNMGGTDIPECLYDEAAQYEEEIRRAIREFHTMDHPGSDLLSYFVLPEDPELEAAIRGKVHAARLDVCSIDGRLYSAVDLELSESLTNREAAALADQLAQQFEADWGAEFETADIPVGEDQEIAVRLYNPDLDICPIEAVQPLSQPETGTSEQRMGLTM